MTGRVRFFETFKVIERGLGDPTVRLESFIVTPTPFADIQIHWETSKAELQEKHILFQED